MTIEKMKERRRELGYSYQQLSEISGVPLGTIQKIFRGETSHPRYATIQALEQALSEKVNSPSSIIQESYSPYFDSQKKQGDFTVDDVIALPEDVRVELIDGVLYDMASPTQIHQLISGEIYRQISNFILDHNGNCRPYIAPMDVQLNCDNKTMLQPDVLIVCEKDTSDRKRIYGAPDFCLEVISPGTRKKDYYIKLNKYLEAGVREYWMVDPEQQCIIVHFFEDETSPAIYPFYGPIPVNIYNGELKIDISTIRHWLTENQNT